MCTFCIYIRCQPRIVCYDPQRETRGWDGPGAYEWDERPDHTDCHTEGTTDGANATLAAPAAPATATEDGGYGTGRTTRGKPSALKGSRPRGMSVRDPERASPVFREGSSEFTSPCQINVRRFPEVPVSKHGAFLREDKDGDSEEGVGGGGSRSSLANRDRADGTGSRQKEPKKVGRSFRRENPGRTPVHPCTVDPCDCRRRFSRRFIQVTKYP